MFSYIRKINKLYNGDDEDHEADDALLFDNQTIAKWATGATGATGAKPEYESGDIPSIFSYN